MKPSDLNVYKSHGGLERFSEEKLIRSLKRSGLPKRHCIDIARKVTKEVRDGSKTRDIYRRTLKLVDQTSHVAAVHYSLKRALFELGPTGHHFETFVSRYFEELGYQTKTCQLIQGKFVKHEVDVVGMKGEKKIFAECKFHNHYGIKNDIKVALYVRARWLDLLEGEMGQNLEDFFLVSNTAFSLDAITYARGTGLRLLGVNAPADCSFLEEIKSRNLYPITSLRRINKHLKLALLERNVLLAKEIPQHTEFLLRLGLKEKDMESLLTEVEILKTKGGK